MNEDTMPHNATGETEEAGETGVAAALLTAAQAAQLLGISTRRLRDWRKEGRIAEAGRFKRGTARVPLFDPADVARLKEALATAETTATVAAPAMDAAAFAEVVARQVAALIAERAATEAASVAPLVALVRDQQETIAALRRRAEAVEAERATLLQRAEDAEREARAEDAGILLRLRALQEENVELRRQAVLAELVERSAPVTPGPRAPTPHHDGSPTSGRFAHDGPVQAAQEAPGVPGASAEVQHAAPGVWGRLRRWWGG